MERETEKKVMNLERKPLNELRKMWKKVYGEEAPIANPRKVYLNAKKRNRWQN